MTQRWVLAVLALSDWRACLSALSRAELEYFQGERCEGRFAVTFDWDASPLLPLDP